MLESIIEWNVYSSMFSPLKSGWYVVALIPKNCSKLTEDEMNDWRKNAGFDKAWHYDGKWFISRIGMHSIDVTDRVTHYGELPLVPKIIR